MTLAMQGEAVGSLYYLMLTLAVLLCLGGIGGLVAGMRSADNARAGMLIGMSLVALLAGSVLAGFIIRHSLPHS